MQQIGRYEVNRQLGQGGMGRVYLARDPTLERSVAIKILHGGTADAHDLLESEAKALAALNHPGIVTIYEIGEHARQRFIAMEYLAGRPLRELLERTPRPPRDELVSICARVAVAVAAAHKAGILHRDIKPENVVVGDDGTVKVVDFGIARRLDPEREPAAPSSTTGRVRELIDAFTQTAPVGAPAIDELATVQTDVAPLTPLTQTVFGTPAYIAPEVLTGTPSSPASDVYSLGVMLYECLAGRRPYEAARIHELFARVIDGSERPARIDDPLAELVERMLAHAPSDRPPLAEIARRLTRLASLPAVPGTRARRRSLTSALLVAVTVAAVGIGGWARYRSGARAAHGPAPALSIAVEDVPVDLPSYGATTPSPATFAAVLALLLQEVDGVRAAPGERLHLDAGGARPSIEEVRAAARELGANLVVRGSLAERGGVVVARFELVDVASGRVEPLEVTGDPLATSALLGTAAEAIVRTRRPDHRRDRRPNRGRALAFYKAGRAQLDRADWSEARPYLEQAVAADPTFPEAWSDVAAVRGWVVAPRDSIHDAITRALELSPPGTRRQILEGAGAYLDNDYARAITLLSPLRDQANLTDDERRDVLYYLGEAYWHDGDHATAAALFRRVLETSPRFKAVTVHLGEHAIAHRAADDASAYLLRQDAQQALVPGWVAMARGDYTSLATDGGFFGIWARLVLGRELREDESTLLGAFGAPTYRVARAIAADDLAAAHRELAALWPTLDTLSPVTGNTLIQLEELGEVLVGAGLVAELQPLLDFMAKHAERLRPAFIYKRLSLLAGPHLPQAVEFPRDALTSRLAHLADALAAERRGDRAAATTALAALVADPSYAWDYPERLALLRNLRALGRAPEARALCQDTLRPPVFRMALLVVQRECRDR